MKYILEYDESDLRGLLVDLENIGLSEKRTYSIWVNVPEFVYPDGKISNLLALIALGDPFWSTGSFQMDEDLIISSLQKGEFSVPNKINWDSISAPSEEDSEERESSINLALFLRPPSMQIREFFTLSEGSLFSRLKELNLKMKSFYSPNYHDGRRLPSTVLTYSKPNDWNLDLTPPIKQVINASKGDGVIIRDLTT